VAVIRTYALVCNTVPVFADGHFPLLIVCIFSETVTCVTVDQWRGSVEILGRNKNCLIRWFRSFAAFDIIQNNVRLSGDIAHKRITYLRS
jgi:hypothetical protein